MRPELRRAIEELGWHCENPREMAAHLTEDEIADINKRGFVTRQLWAALDQRAYDSEPKIDIVARLAPHVEAV
jgi:hypothetical protein